ncbi:MAG: carbohydrate ABC transporter permease, partial [Clostridiaceae bacterium]|nr:carbohydrate ABC transporter permease [Clostridiaceae bacterium]
ESLIESARIDGAGEFRTFFKIVIPLALPGLATVALFNSVTIWNDYWVPLVFITKASLYNLQYSMYIALLNVQYIAENSGRMSNSAVTSQLPVETIRMAMCIIGIGPIVLAYPFFQKYFIKGLTIGAVKG